MVQWERATKTDRRVYRAVSLVLTKHPYLLKFLFDPVEPRLRLAPEELLRESAHMSSGEDLLVRVALDLWSGSGDAHVWELIEILDNENLLNVAQALRFLRTKFDGWDGPVTRLLE
jgi:hypothetical protein